MVAFDCVFLQNQATGAGRGGALDMGDGIRHSMRSCYFVGNSAGEAGGAVACSGIVELASSLFSSNSAGNGGALSVPAGVNVAFYDDDPAVGGALLGHEAEEGGDVHWVRTRLGRRGPQGASSNSMRPWAAFRMARWRRVRP